ncbi:MogA/MoaB family molybdenum cofactor biosynthesis protein [Aureibacillus halotolerans]|uniref:Molybdenum cofactor biosynthesis protein B n=1 Tax=Aureibacillus halotolerans TaxID=1508390 RepID=A0A4R6UCD7_9BACI|nr:MogA/MoaB family molybdenum cofactor biosynthesis protein [Aureibacillus halotolerans]TDQ40744.1 molybdopterin adenylyltransferase [Aureibacillus halotolerans]
MKTSTHRVVHCAVVTISDTRTTDTDSSGGAMLQMLENAGHAVTQYTIVPDEHERIVLALSTALEDPDVQIILMNGGTGISPRDVTVETVQPLFDKELVGFGELFRMLSYHEEIGSASLLSRATAGVINNKVVFCTPGSTKAVKLAMERLILPELVHLINEIEKGGTKNE